MVMVSCPSCGNKVKIREIKNEKSQWIYRRSKWSNTRANPTREDSRRIKCQRGKQMKIKRYTKDDIMKMIEEAPDIDYVGEFIRRKLEDDSLNAGEKRWKN